LILPFQFLKKKEKEQKREGEEERGRGSRVDTNVIVDLEK
jgi:hypothetical protein